MIVLGIESTCDETAAALVEDGRKLLSNVISTSVKEQALYGGVVPEIASRRHCEFISAILYMAVDCMREMLLEGKKIRLGDLGDFSVLLSSKGAEDADKFTAQNITDVKVQWEPGQQFKTLRDDAEFNLVASRSAQAAVIKAIKEGKTSVDLNAPTTPEGGGDGTSGGGSTTGGTGGENTGGSENTGGTGSDGQGGESSGTEGGGGQMGL